MIPFNVIRLFATGPGDLTTLDDYDDWISELVIHEHTHVLHLDTISGLPALINTLLGKVYPPNLVQPRWFIEGVAVHHESAHTSAGRLRGTQFDMYLRMDALDDRLLGLDELSNVPIRWPHGNAWYLYGSRFVRYIVDRFGEQVLARMSHDYGSEPVPYGLNRICQRATGHTFEELYEDWQAATRRRYLAVERDLRRQGLQQGQRLTHHAENARYPRFLPDGRLTYWASTGRETTEIRTIDPATGAGGDRFFRVRGEAVTSPHPDGRRVFFSESLPFRDRYTFTDLAVYDESTGDVDRLTEGLRAAMPDVAPDGRRIAFVLNGAGTRHLAVAEIDSVESTHRIVVRSPRFGQVYTPKWSPHGDTLAYSVWRPGGYRDIALLDVRSGAETRVTHDRALDTGPEWSPDGRYLYFSSDRTGIANIYRYETSTGEILQVTNVVGGAYQPSISPDGSRMAYVGYSSRGFDIWGFDLHPASHRQAPHFVDERPPSSETSATVTALSEPYNPINTLVPRSYELSLSSDGFGTRLVVSVDAQDLAGWFNYTGSVAVGLSEGDIDGALSFTVLRAPLPITLSAFRQVSPRGGFFAEGLSREWVAEEIGGSIGVAYPLPGRFHFENVSLRYTLSHVGQIEPLEVRADPNDPPPRLPRTGLTATLSAGWSWSDAYRTTYDISNSWGRTIRLSIAAAHPSLGSQFEGLTTRWSGTQYIENPWIEHHVLALGYLGGISTGRAFSVGGFPQQDLLQALLDQAFLGGQVLRGYPQATQLGRHFHLLQAEYRFPIVDPTWSIGLLPLYLARVWGNVFVDAGSAFDRFDSSNLLYGAGGELLLEFLVGYTTSINVRIGTAYGFSQGGEPQFYFNLGTPFP